MSIDGNQLGSAAECIERICLGVSPEDFGFRIQGLAAHVLLRLGYRVETVNAKGHPDIVAVRGGREARFEVEAETARPRPRQLTEADFSSLIGSPQILGYYALAISSPAPYWVLVPASKLVDRKHPSSNVLLEALSDKVYSTEWTDAYVRLLNDSCELARLASFGDLCEWARAGRGL